MTKEEIIILLKKAQRIAEEKYKIKNILKPGVVKELIIASILGHEVLSQKGLADAKDKYGNYYEYLSSINRYNVKTNKGSSFQIDRLTENNLDRITKMQHFILHFLKIT